MHRRFTLSIVLTLASFTAHAQGGDLFAPGDTLTWERVGDIPIDALAFAVAPDSTLFAVGRVSSIGARRLDLTAGFPGTWVFLSDDPITDALIALGPDTLLSTQSGRTRRSTDGGLTWPVVLETGSGEEFGAFEMPPGLPGAGTLLLGTTPVSASTDRGTTWETRGSPDGTDGLATAFVALTEPPYRGRIVASAFWGAAYSDDVGHTWALSSFWNFGRFATRAAAVVRMPSGTERVIVVGVDQTLPYVRAWYSDDGGETWGPEDGYPLVGPLSGLGRSQVAGVWALGGAAAVAVLGPGQVYQTDDGGQTWILVGHVPEIDGDRFAFTSIIGADDRLYVGVDRTGPENAWVWRTQEAVRLPVASEPGPESEVESLGLFVRPNPSLGSAIVEVVLARPETVRLAVYDILGRTVAVLHDGALPAGVHPFTVRGKALTPGVYLARAQTASGGEASERLTVLR